MRRVGQLGREHGRGYRTTTDESANIDPMHIGASEGFGSGGLPVIAVDHLTDAERTAFAVVAEAIFRAGQRRPDASTLLDFADYDPALLWQHVHKAIVDEWGGPEPPDYKRRTWTRGERAGRSALAVHWPVPLGEDEDDSSESE